MNVELDSYGSRLLYHLIDNHAPIGKDELKRMSNMRMMDVIPILAVMCDRDIVRETENGYVLVE